MPTKAGIVRVKNTKISFTSRLWGKNIQKGDFIKGWFFETCTNKGKKSEKKTGKCLP